MGLEQEEPIRISASTENKNITHRRLGLCFAGGGLRAMSSDAALVCSVIASDIKSGDEDDQSLDDALNNVFSKFSFISSNSGGSWFTYGLLMSSKFEAVLKSMVRRYLRMPRNSQSSDVQQGKNQTENPFYAEFLKITLANIHKWDKLHPLKPPTFWTWIRQYLYIFRFIKQKEKEELGDLYKLFIHARNGDDTWLKFVHMLLSPLYSKIPEWVVNSKKSITWFINVSVNLPRSGKLRTNEEEINKELESEDGIDHDEAVIIRRTSGDAKTDNDKALKYLALSSFNPNPLSGLEKHNAVPEGDVKTIYKSHYKRLFEEDSCTKSRREEEKEGGPSSKEENKHVFGRIDFVPGAFKVIAAQDDNERKSEKSEEGYQFLTPRLKKIKLHYTFDDIVNKSNSEPFGHTYDCSNLEDDHDFTVQKPLIITKDDLNATDKPQADTETKEKNYKKFLSLIEKKRNKTGTQSLSTIEKRKIHEVVYRVAASSAALGAYANYLPQDVLRAIILNYHLDPEIDSVDSGTRTSGNRTIYQKFRDWTTNCEEKVKIKFKQDLLGIMQMFYRNHEGIVVGELEDMVEEKVDEVAIPMNFGRNEDIVETTKLVGDEVINSSGTSEMHNIGEWELRGEKIAGKYDSLLKRGELFAKESDPNTQQQNQNSNKRENQLTLEKYVKAMPISVFDGGFTDNSGIGRAVMDHVEWTMKNNGKCSALITSVLHFVDDFIQLFENSNFNEHPDPEDFKNMSLTSPPNCHINFEIFKCSKEDMISLKEILDPTLDQHNFPFQTSSFTCTERRILKAKIEEDKDIDESTQTKKKRFKKPLLKQFFMCKFRNLKIAANPYYFGEDIRGHEIEELSVVFVVPKDDFGIQKGALDTNLQNYGYWIEEIHDLLKKGIDVNQVEIGSDYLKRFFLHE